MDSLILSCGTGGGHDAAARALVEAMELRGHRAVMLNPYTLQSRELAGRIDRLYIGSVQKAPSFFGAVYAAGQLYRKLPFRSPVYYVNLLMRDILGEYLSRNHFDVIITTHLFPAEIITGMKNSGSVLPGTIYVATDYVCLPFTEETECDAYVIPTEELTEHFVLCGLPEEKIYPLGIPVSGAFSARMSRDEAREALGLEQDRKYVLVSGGSMGGGQLRNAVKALTGAVSQRSGTELIIICGSNARLYEELSSAGLPHTSVVGFTREMPAYMRAADLFVTKPGGLSSTEAAVCGVPMVDTAAIPGCETHKARYFSFSGMSLSWPPSPGALEDALGLLDSFPARAAMLRSQHRIIRPDAAAQICALAEDMADIAGEDGPARLRRASAS